MAMITEIPAGTGVLGYSINGTDETITIEYYRGKDVAVLVPEAIENKPVAKVGKKAFLGIKSVVKISLPDSVKEIGDWAFASCSSLEEIIFPSGNPTLGNKIFRDCTKLKDIIIRGLDSLPEGSAGGRLMALMVNGLDAQYLFSDALTQWGKGNNPFLNQELSLAMDGVILQYLKKDESEGFSKMLLCGEEDYVGDDSNLDNYRALRIREKIRVLFIRMMNPVGLSEDNRKLFSEYLKANMKENTWPLVLEEHGDEQAYFDLLIECGCIHEGNMGDLIAGMGDRNTAMKGYLLSLKGENLGETDFFADLDF